MTEFAVHVRYSIRRSFIHGTHFTVMIISSVQSRDIQITRISHREPNMICYGFANTTESTPKLDIFRILYMKPPGHV
jgi:hypothetical protein